MLAQRIQMVDRPIIHDGLVHWWPLNAGSGSTANDKAGALNGTLTNMEADDWEASPVGHGWCLDFDGTNEYISCGTLTSINLALASTPFTVTANIYVDEWSGATPSTEKVFQALVFGSGDYASASFQLYLGKITFVSSTTGAWWLISNNLGTSVLDLSTAYAISVSRSAAGVYTAWLNGVSDGTITVTGNLVLNSQEVKMGAHYSLNTDYMTKGKIWDVRIYNRELSSTEQLAIARGQG